MAQQSTTRKIDIRTLVHLTEGIDAGEKVTRVAYRFSNGVEKREDDSSEIYTPENDPQPGG